VRQGGVLSPVVFAIYMDVLIVRLRNAGYGCRLLNEFYGCLLYYASGPDVFVRLASR